MKHVTNLVYDNIKDFEPGQSIYITISERPGYSTAFLCEFIKLEANIVTGKVVAATVNESLYKHRIKDGWVISAPFKKCSLWGATANQKRATTHWFDARGFAAYEKMEKMEDLMPEKHESYAVLSMSRGHTNVSRSMFGSSIKHSNVISLRIDTATLNRDLHKDSIFPEKRLIEIEMSEAQFAQAITTFNQGSGTPVTLTYHDRKNMEPCPYVSKVEQFSQEFKQRMDELNYDLEQELQHAREILTSGKAPNKGERDIILRAMETLTKQLSSNIPFVAKQFDRQMDQTITEAKKEIEAFMRKEADKYNLKLNSDSDVLKLD